MSWLQAASGTCRLVQPNKHDPLIQCRTGVGAASTTLAQHFTLHWISGPRLLAADNRDDVRVGAGCGDTSTTGVERRTRPHPPAPIRAGDTCYDQDNLTPHPQPRVFNTVITA